MRILLVDDDNEIRYALANVFKVKHNFTVVEASSGQDAINSLTHEKDFSLIISDIQMDNGNGHVIVDYLKNQGLDVPFIFFTGSQEVSSVKTSNPVLKVFSKSEVFHLIEYVESMSSLKFSQRKAI